MMNQNVKGILMALAAATLWGVSGTCGQFLFQQRGISIEWLMSVRMLGAGIILLIIAFTRRDPHVWNIWHSQKSRYELILFGIFGMLAVQYTYFAAIKHSNAATATTLQFSAPVLIAAYLALRYGQRLSSSGYLAIVFALLGTFLLVTHGDIGTLTITPLALALGIASAVSLAVYTLLPINLLKRHSALSVIGWGMVIGGVVISFINPPWKADGIWDIQTGVHSVFVVLFGTLFPFYMYLKGVQLIGGQKASLLTSAEPLSATFLAVVWLGVTFHAMDWIGALLIITTVFILSIKNTARP